MPRKKTDAAADKPAPAKRGRKKTAAAPGSAGLSPAETASASPPPEVAELAAAIEQDGGAVLARYREPLGGTWLLLAALPIEQTIPTPYQRDLSETHVKRLAGVMEKTERYLDPIIAVRTKEREYQTPNGHHRLGAARSLGLRAIPALVVPDPRILYRILALNTEKAHGLRERALEVIRMARGLAPLGSGPESAWAFEFEEPALLTLGACYEKNGRFSGGAYNPVVRRVEGFLDLPLAEALGVRDARAARLLALDEGVAARVAELKERGFKSPYLRNFIVARLNPLRFKRGATLPFDELLEQMEGALAKLDLSKVRPEEVSAAGGAPPEEEAGA